jgi:hypothetical protein
MDMKNESRFLTEIEPIKQVEFQLQSLAINDNTITENSQPETPRLKK